MKKLNKYLNKIQTDESVGSFAIDSVDGFKRKKPLVMRTVYPEQAIPFVDNSDNRVMIDFDGTINSYKNGWNDGKLIDPPMDGAKESLEELKRMGFEIVIFTTRASKIQNIDSDYDEIIEDLKRWLGEYQIPYDFITAEKLAALWYIDDKAIRHVDWKTTMNELKQDWERPG